MKTSEEILYHDYEIGIRDKVIENMNKLKQIKEYYNFNKLTEDAYYLTIKEMKNPVTELNKYVTEAVTYSTETREWTSALVTRTEYNPNTKELILEFKNGKKYLYKKFDEEQYQAFCSAESQGKYFLAEIRKKYKDTEDVIKLELDEQSTGS